MSDVTLILRKLHEALNQFAIEDPQKAELVKLRYFVGLTLGEAAATLGVPEGTAKRWWTYSRARRCGRSEPLRKISDPRRTRIAH